MNKQEILEQLNLKVKGHDKAKKCLMSLFERAKVRYYQLHPLAMEKDSSTLVTNKNVLLVGKSGNGKTLLAETCAKLYKMPFMTIDATTLTVTSADGGVKLADLTKRITDYATAFLANHKNDYFSVQGVIDQMIIFIDEFDKLGNLRSDTGWYKQVQSSFLRFFENKVKGFHNISFIFAGAFMYADVYEKDVVKNSIGFFESQDKEEQKHDLEEKIISAGILPEIVGRIHHIIKLDDLTKNDYREILTQWIIPSKSEQLLVLTGEELNISDEFIETIVSECYDSDQGVRLLSKRVEEISLDLESDNDKYDFLRI